MGIQFCSYPPSLFGGLLVKQVLNTWCAIAVFTLVIGATSSVLAQTPSATPDPFVAQLTNSPSSLFGSFAGDVTANGRFAVFVSNGDLATERTAARNNADGNYEL